MYIRDFPDKGVTPEKTTQNTTYNEHMYQEKNFQWQNLSTEFITFRDKFFLNQKK